jgi:hypothetical protein
MIALMVITVIMIIQDLVLKEEEDASRLKEDFVILMQVI